jgi:hypothetical protein
MLAAGGSLAVSAGIAAQAFVSRTWCTEGPVRAEVFVNPFTPFHFCWVHRFQVGVYTSGGSLRRGSVLELFNVIDSQGNYYTLPTLPSEGCQGFHGLRYNGPPFHCIYGCGWRALKGALLSTDVVRMSVVWMGEQSEEELLRDPLDPPTAPCKVFNKSTRRRSTTSRTRSAG